MQQLRSPQTERRRDVRCPKAFAFWVKPGHGRRRFSAWMLDVSAGGAAFLTAAENVPPVGARVALAEMQTHDRLVREGAGALPAFARVLRHDDARGITRRVAVRFEDNAHAVLRLPTQRLATAACPRMPTAPPPAPPQVQPGVQMIVA